MKAIQRRLIWLAGALVVVLILLGNASTIISEAWWFDSVNYSSVFWTILSWKALLWISAFVLYALILWVNFWVANRLTRGRAFRRFEGANIQIPGQRIFNIFVGIGVVIISLIAASATLPWWETILKYLHASNYGATDPIFQRDVGFYLFQLPFYEGAQSWLLTLFVLSLLLAGVVYFLKGAIQFVRNRQKIFTGSVKIHLSILLVIIAVLLAVDFWLKRFGLLFSSSGVVYGAGYTDMHATLLSYWVMVVVTLGIAILFVISLFRRGIGLLVSGVGVFLVSLILINGIYPWFQQTFVVEPNELDREKPYIRHNIDYTRMAYKLDDVQREAYNLQGTLTQELISRNQPTIQNIRLWDARPLLSTYRQIQEIRLYYKFSDVDIDRYTIDGNYRQMMISPREFSYQQVPTQARTWQNQRLTYTHGYGVAMSPVNIVTPEGLPELFIKDIPPVSSVDLQVTRPGIYYGEETGHYVFTGATTEEFDYPVGGENMFTHYEGLGGVPMSNIWRRMLYAYEFGSIKILISGYFTNESRVHYHRQIAERVRNVAPFLEYDRDPYITIIDGELKWILDAYTTSQNFPYAEPMMGGNTNYIRNSVKVVIDAYEGTMDFYVVDNEDPVIRTYQKIFPDLFKSSGEVPERIRAHFRYPEDLFLIQSQAYLAYHMTSPEVYYNREDMWRMPTEIYEGNEQRMEPYYVIMRLPGHEEEEFVLFLPFTPVNKNNMIAWMAARSDAENYGELVLYEFPKQELIFGPMQIEARIDQHPDISELLTLWSQQGSNVIRGNLLVIPIENTLLYVEPLYIRSEQGQMPELKRVIVSYENQIVMQETLDRSLAAIFGEAPEVAPGLAAAPSPGTERGSGNIQSLIQSSNDAFQQAQQMLRDGDWTGYGQQIQRLGDLLSQLQAASRPDTVQTGTPGG
ncbi:MAG TPA: UPF0182 family protein [bacterium]|nr:UPF0182 family protein [bacterium]